MSDQPQSTLKKLCPTCGKPMAGGRRAGSLTAFMFGGADCSCGRRGKAARPSDDTDFCPKCGLKVENEQRAGSLTGFLFQSTRCKCLRDKDFAEGNMTSKFWKLKEADAGTIFMSADTSISAQAKGPAIGLAPGAIIGGVYEIIQLIGRGGMGEVYLARHKTLGKKCALKVIPPEQVTEMGWQRFQLEAKAVAKLDHVNLVKVTDLGIHDGCLPFYAMDYVDGQNLADLLAASGPMPLKTALDIFQQVCDGVDNAHRNGILHRDLKPANIMLTSPQAGPRTVKILDFGLAKLTTHDRSKQSLTAVGDVFGSPFYMSPEQCNGDKLDRRSDIYSIGCTMFECLTGQPPFTGHLAAAIIFSQQEADPPSLAQIAGGGKFPESIEIVMAKLLRKNPVERYQTLQELRADLVSVARGEKVLPYYMSRSAVSESVVEPAERAPERSSFGIFVAAFVVILLIGAGGAFFLFNTRRPAPHPPAPVAMKQLEKPFSGEALGNAIYLTESAPTMIIPRSAADTNPYSSILVERGKKVRRFRFPTDYTLGEFRLTSRQGWFEAKGIVTVDADDGMVLRPFPSTYRYPNYLARFRDGDLWGVRLETRDERPEPQTMLKVLKMIASWPSLRLLEMFVENWQIGAKEVSELEKMSGLTALRVSSTKLDPAQLAKLSRLNGLDELTIRKPTDVHAILEHVKDSPKLRILSMVDSKVSLDDLKLIAAIPNLQELTVNGFVPEAKAAAAEGLTILSKSGKVRLIQIEELNMPDNGIEILNLFKELKELRFAEPSRTSEQSDGLLSPDSSKIIRRSGGRFTD